MVVPLQWGQQVMLGLVSWCIGLLENAEQENFKAWLRGTIAKCPKQME